MNVQSLMRIERLNYIVGGVLIAAAAIVGTPKQALGVLVGVVLSCVNFSIMRRMVQHWLKLPPEKRAPQSMLLLPKMAGLMLAVFLAVFFLPISAIGVLIGFSVFLLSVGVETVRFSLGSSSDGSAEPDSADVGAGDGAKPQP